MSPRRGAVTRARVPRTPTDQSGAQRQHDQILGDPVMRDVVTTALGIPLEIAFQPLEAQEKAVTAQLDITKFKDPKFVESFIDRYLIANSASASATSAPDLTTLSVEA